MEPKMLTTLVLLVVVLVVDRAKTCPERYSRFSLQHSYCKDRNLTCNIIKRGVDKVAKKIIVHEHNKLRSGVANGKENRAGGLPKASNMLQMEWDKELATIAQKWAEQCVPEHDCEDCRRVENFYVGQNIAKEYASCSSIDCSNIKPNWRALVAKFYNQVSLYSKDYINPPHFDNKFGQFTQVVSAYSWKVGCGYVAFQSGEGVESIYVCNYGPGGNIVDKPLYIPGRPSSACPHNSCGACKMKGPLYLGLCKVRNTFLGPVYEKRSDSLLDCKWNYEKPYCKVKAKGKKSWKSKRALGGFYKTAILEAGEKSTLEFTTPVQPNNDTFCVVIRLRKGPVIAGEKDSSVLSLLLDVPEVHNITSINLQVNTTRDFVTIYNDIGWNMETKLALEAYVPLLNAPKHIIEIKGLTAFDGVCDNPRIKERY